LKGKSEKMENSVAWPSLTGNTRNSSQKVKMQNKPNFKKSGWGNQDTDFVSSLFFA